MSKGKTIKDYIQKSKEDWWSCKCGSYHKGFPYKCPVREVENRCAKETASMRLKLQRLRKDNKSLEDKLNDLNIQLRDSQNQYTKVQVLKEKEKNTVESSQVFHIKEENKRFKKELKKIQDDYELLHKTREKQQAFLQKKEDKAAILQSDVEQLKNEIKSLDVENQSCKKDIGRLKDFDYVRDENKGLATQNRELSQELKELNRVQGQLEKDVQNVRAKLGKKEEAEERLQQKNEQFMSDNKKLTQEMKEQQKARGQLEKDVQNVRMQLEKKGEQAAQFKMR